LIKQSARRVWIGRGERKYLCLFSVDLLNFMKLLGLPVPPTSCRANIAVAARRSRNAHPAVITCREKMACTVLVVFVIAILRTVCRVRRWVDTTAPVWEDYVADFIMHHWTYAVIHKRRRQ
jgi:hypothetical protein